MFIHQEENHLPIQIWCSGPAAVEGLCLEQASHLAALPFAHGHIALMPDTHPGKGMPIGGVIACENVVIPNAVGVDIGCGMGFVQTDVPVAALRETMTGNGTLLQAMIGDILRNIPTGKNHHRLRQASAVLDRAHEELDRYELETALLPQLEDGYFQIGTLGGGNHFIELQEAPDGTCAIMLHSGSRHFGNQVGQYFNAIAAAQNARWHSSVPAEWNLPFLPADSPEGVRYLHWMQLSMDFAQENRDAMLRRVKEIFGSYTEKFLGIVPEYSEEINCHHNYAALEEHDGRQLWVHRKGAVSAREDELAVIPGAMGSYSFVVRGKGNPESFCSSSHGAGRVHSRTAAMQAFSTEQVMVDLKANGVVLGKCKKSDVAEECRFAYKDITEVMANQANLTVPVKRLFTVGVVKG